MRLKGIAVFACLLVSPAAIAGYPPSTPSFHSFSLSGDGSGVFYVGPSSQGPALWRRPAIPGGRAELVTPWGPGSVRFATARSSNAIVLMEMQQGVHSQSLTLLRHSNSGWERTPLLTDVLVSALDASADDSFHVVLQEGPEQFRRLSFNEEGAIASEEKFSLPAMDVVYGPSVTPRIYLDSGAATPTWREVGVDKDGDGKDDVVSLPQDIQVERYLFASGKDPVIYVLARLADNDALQVIGINWRDSSVTTFFGQKGLDVDSPIRSPDGNNVDGIRIERERPRNYASSPSLAQDSIFLESEFGVEPEILSRSFDNKTWLLRVARLDRPVEYWIHDHIEKTNFRVDPAQPDKSDIVPPSSFSTELTSDGFEIPYYLAAPRKDACDVSLKSCPLIVLIHGGPSRRDRLPYDPETAWYQRQGYWVARVNFRGSSGYGTHFRRAGDRQWGAAMVDDVNTVIQRIVTKPGIDTKAVTAVGSSYGGFAAIASALRSPSLYRCSISINGGGDLVQMARAGKKRAPELARGIAMQVGDPDVPDDLAGIKAQSPSEHAAKFKTELLQVVSLQDQVSDPLQSLNFDAALRLVGHSPQLLKLDDADHLVSQGADRVVMYDAIRSFLHERCN